MGVFTFVCKSKGGEWTAKQHEGDLEASASSTYDLQRKLVQTALSADSSVFVFSRLPYLRRLPEMEMEHVIIGGAAGGGFSAGGGAAAGGGGGGGEAAAASKEEEKKKEESEDEEGGFGFDFFG